MNALVAWGIPFDWEGMQSALRPAGLGALLVEQMWWITLAVFTAVWLLVMAATLYALLRRPADQAGGERRARRGVIAATGVTAVILLLFFGLSLYIGLHLGRSAEPPALRVEVRGHQWWWEVRYLDARGDPIAITANELHLPVSEPAQLIVETADVIHSFWVPNLHGKMDMIPGRRNKIIIHPLETGVFRSQCAEFCGVQHAKMAMMVVVQPPEQFERWLLAHGAPARPPQTELALRGQQVFLRNCAVCHTVRGTVADGRTAPDLTNIASRLTVAAGTLPNTAGHLGGWVANPQSIKPGNFMPWVPMQPEEFRAVLEYLASLR